MNKIKVLLIEDDRSISNFITATMDREGYKIMHALNGREGLSLSTSFCPNVILLDLGLPDMDGLDVLQKLRSWSDVPVIIISARTKEQEKVSALDLGADDYITKPFGSMELLARVHSNLRRYEQILRLKNAAAASQKETEEAHTLTAGGLELDLYTKQLTVDGKNVKLTPKEYAILELLMRSPGRVYSAEQIYENVWKEEAINTETIMVHVRKLREKIEVNPRNPRYLKVVWGIGYKIEK